MLLRFMQGGERLIRLHSNYCQTVLGAKSLGVR